MKFDRRNAGVVLVIVALALLAGGMIPFSDYYAESNSSTMSRSPNHFFDYTDFTYPAKVEVRAPAENISIGFGGGTEALDFGLAISGGSINRKFINITNSADRDARVTLSSQGTISGMITFKDNGFILNPGETRTVAIELTPGQSSYGNYSGYIAVELRKAHFGMFEIFV